ncbi:NAD(P)/FAD-dependent oxidoreductase [Streptomyces sp. ISL-94]|uniref:flavin monoamine oxidase family protein n=1 Tax=Streptomyces sp. ISL-94 TaxID=2819190 RepID=UPI001BE6D849|nr:NAD(P)/FAD-dependent oxidoreductase [Streptomyces sp. ISL-94]MBT2479358.1 FAD-dependent oxidoreductase [Streptomyces sp. ISL-94]
MNRHGGNYAVSSDRTIGRRSLLKAAGVTALASTLAATTAGRASAVEELAWDAIVIGAGYAGGTAARELAAKGLNTLVLEARDRIGGRIWTGSFAGEQVDIGGGWFGPGQTNVERELQRYHITTSLDVAATRAVMPSATGFTSQSPADAFGHLGTLFGQFYAGSETYFERPLEPLYRKDLLASVDATSLAARLDQLGLSATDQKWINGSTSVFAGGPSSSGGLAGMAQWFQLAGGTYEGFESTMSLKPAGGMVSILKAMFAESTARIRYNSPVTAVTDTGSGLTKVKTAGGLVYQAPVVVVAVPVNVWRTITFNPGLPKVHADAALEGVGVPTATKLWLQVSGVSDAVYAQAPEGSPILLMLPQKQLADGSRLYVAFAGSGLNVSDAAAVKAAVRGLVPEATVVDYRAMQWGKEAYTRGGWGLRKPGQLLRQLPAIQQPHGRMVFAGSDIASGWYGAFVEGAIESGLTAAQQAAVIAG